MIKTINLQKVKSRRVDGEEVRKKRKFLWQKEIESEVDYGSQINNSFEKNFA